MSSSSETSLAELPQPYDISSAVSKALCIEHQSASGGIVVKPEIGVCSNNNNTCGSRRPRSASFPVSTGYMSSYEMQVQNVPGVNHQGCSYSVGDGSDTYSAAPSPYYCPPGPSNHYTPYYPPHPAEAAQYLYPLHQHHHPHQHHHHHHPPHHQQQQQQQQHYIPTAILHHQMPEPPPQPSPRMEMEPWNETAAISICNSSTSIFDSQENIEQLDKFCKYIDSSGDEEFMTDKDGGSSVEGCSGEVCNGAGCSGSAPVMDCSMMHANKNRYKCFITGNPCSEMLDSPPKKKHRSACTMSGSDYYSDDVDNAAEASLVERTYNSSPTEERNWIVDLDNASMWREFDMVGTEMVITKAGRRMFPTLALKVSGLDPRETYSVKLDILPADHRRYKYLQSEWVAVGRSDKKQIYCEYEHPDSPNSGSYWTDKVVAFKMVKLTNNKATKSVDQIILNSMHKYIPCMKITCLKDGYTQTFSFPETTFIAVTAYQSTGVTQLKINNNPYARAFRDSIPSNGGQKAGGHFRQNGHKRTNSYSTNGSTSRGGSDSRSSTPSTSPKRRTKHSKLNKQSNSAASMESGFESDPGNKKDAQTHPFNSSSSSLINCWPEENNLWTPGLMDSGNSLSGAYMDHTRVAMEYEVQDTPEGEVSEGEMLRTLPDPSLDLGLKNVEAAIPIEDDVFF